MPSASNGPASNHEKSTRYPVAQMTLPIPAAARSIEGGEGGGQGSGLGSRLGRGRRVGPARFDQPGLDGVEHAQQGLVAVDDVLVKAVSEQQLAVFRLDQPAQEVGAPLGQGAE
ncbi:MAG: hypothetical protein AAGK32_11570, partial [Actinomycetota bacterium]